MSDNGSQSAPPRGESEKAEKYITQLATLIDQDKLTVQKTDLSKYDPSAFQDHYRVDVKDYQIEISHSTPNESHNSYVMLFTNLKNVAEGACEKVILAYVYLAEDQYRKFKEVADDQIERIRRREEERKFSDALSGFDTALSEVGSMSSSSPVTETASPPPAPAMPQHQEAESELSSETTTQDNPDTEKPSSTSSSPLMHEDSTYTIRPAQA